MKSLSYIDALVTESKKLVTKTDEKIKLPMELKEAEDTMNQIKKEANIITKTNDEDGVYHFLKKWHSKTVD